MGETNLKLRDRQRVERRAGVLEAAWKLLSERGYAGWTLADLADRAGIARRTLYLYFSSKEEIAAETVARNIRLTAAQVRSIGSGGTPLERLRGVVRWFVERGAEPAGLPVAPIKAEPGLMATVRTFPEYQAALAELTGALAELIETAQDAGSVTKVLPAATLAGLLLQLLRGVDAARWQEETGLGDAVVEVLFGGLGHP